MSAGHETVEDYCIGGCIIIFFVRIRSGDTRIPSDGISFEPEREKRPHSLVPAIQPVTR